MTRWWLENLSSLNERIKLAGKPLTTSIQQPWLDCRFRFKYPSAELIVFQKSIIYKSVREISFRDWHYTKRQIIYENRENSRINCICALRWLSLEKRRVEMFSRDGDDERRLLLFASHREGRCRLWFPRCLHNSLALSAARRKQKNKLYHNRAVNYGMMTRNVHVKILINFSADIKRFFASLHGFPVRALSLRPVESKARGAH